MPNITVQLTITNMKNLILILIACLSLSIVSCKKEVIKPNIPPVVNDTTKITKALLENNDAIDSFSITLDKSNWLFYSNGDFKGYNKTTYVNLNYPIKLEYFANDTIYRDTTINNSILFDKRIVGNGNTVLDTKNNHLTFYYHNNININNINVDILSDYQDSVWTVTPNVNVKNFSCIKEVIDTATGVEKYRIKFTLYK